MSLIYDSKDSRELLGALSANLSDARSAIEATEAACHRVVASVRGGELSGRGYSAAGRLFSEAILPNVADAKRRLERLQADLDKFAWEDSKISHFGVLKEDPLRGQLEATIAQRDATERLIEFNRVAANTLPAIPWWRESVEMMNRRLELVLGQLESDVRELEDRLQALQQFDRATRGLFDPGLLESGLLPDRKSASPSARAGTIQPVSLTVPAPGAGIPQIAQWLMSGAYSIAALVAACGGAAVMAAMTLIIVGGVGTGSRAGSGFYTPEERERRARLDMYYWTHNLDGSVKQHIGPAPSPFAKYLNEAPTFEDVDAIVKEKTRKGKNSGVREVDTPEEVRDIYEEITRGSEPIDDVGTYNGEKRRLPDGTEIGIREDSKSGGITIDIKSPTGKDFKIHLPKGWGK